MKTTLKAIIIAIPALSKLAASDLNLRLAYRLQKNIAELQNEADFFTEQRKKLLDKYGTVGKDGNYTFDGDNESLAEAELIELLGMEVSPEIERLEIPLTEDVRLSVNDLGALEPFVSFTNGEV